MNKNICKKCGKEFDLGFTVCPFCGAKCDEKDPKQKAKSPASDIVLRVLALLAVAVVVVSVALGAMGKFSVFGQAQKEAEDLSGEQSPVQDGGDIKTAAELARAGIPYSISGFAASDGDRGEIISREIDEETGEVSVVLSSGRAELSAKSWLYHDIDDVENELVSSLGFEESDIYRIEVYSEFLKEGLIIGQYKGDDREPLLEGDSDYYDKIWFKVVTRDTTCANTLNAEEFLSDLESDMDGYELGMTEESQYTPVGLSAESAIRLAFLITSRGVDEIYPYIKNTVYKEGGTGTVGEASGADGISELTVYMAIPETVEMPNVVGMDEQAARELLASRGISSELIVTAADRSLPARQGCVTATSPGPGAEVGRETRVVIFVAE